MPVNMNTSQYDFLFSELDRFLKDNSQYVTRQYSSSGKELPFVQKEPPASPQYPLLVFSEIANANDTMTVDRRQVIDVLGFEVDIHAKNLAIKGETISRIAICQELAELSDRVMFYYRLRRISKTPTPVVDTTLRRIVSRYNGRVFNNYNQIL